MKTLIITLALLAPAALSAGPILYQTVIVYPQSTAYLTPEPTQDSYFFELPWFAQEEALGLILSTGNNPCYVNCYAHVDYPNSYPHSDPQPQPQPSSAPEPSTFLLTGTCMIAALATLWNLRDKRKEVRA